MAQVARSPRGALRMLRPATASPCRRQVHSGRAPTQPGPSAWRVPIPPRTATQSCPPGRTPRLRPSRTYPGLRSQRSAHSPAASAAPVAPGAAPRPWLRGHRAVPSTPAPLGPRAARSPPALRHRRRSARAPAPIVSPRGAALSGAARAGTGEQRTARPGRRGPRAAPSGAVRERPLREPGLTRSTWGGVAGKPALRKDGPPHTQACLLG